MFRVALEAGQATAGVSVWQGASLRFGQDVPRVSLWDTGRAADRDRRTPSIRAWAVQLPPVSSPSESPSLLDKLL